MGVGKEAPGGGDGVGKGAETLSSQAPVVLGMELHCAGCAKKVVKSIKHLPGVKSVVADAAASRVVVEGTADAAALKARIETKTKKPVQIVSGGASNKAAAESKADKGGGSGEKKKSDKDGGGEMKGDKDSQSLPREEKEKKQPPEEKKPKETVLLKIRLHCRECADRIRRRIYKIKGVRDVIVEGSAEDEVEVTGTMDVAAMLVYLKEKLNRTVEAVPSGKKDGGNDKEKGGGDGEKKKDKAAAAGSNIKQGKGKDTEVAATSTATTAADRDIKQYKGKGVEVTGPSTATAAASMAPAPAGASTYHVSPYGYIPYTQPQAPQPSYYNYYGGNANDAGHSNAVAYYQHPAPVAGAYIQHPTPDAGSYYNHPAPDAGAYYNHPAPDAGAYYNHPAPDAGAYYNHPAPDAGAYYHHPGANAEHNPQPYPYRFDMAPAPQMFSDENPNGCSVM